MAEYPDYEKKDRSWLDEKMKEERTLLLEFIKFIPGKYSVADRGGMIWFWYDTETNKGVDWNEIIDKFNEQR